MLAFVLNGLNNVLSWGFKVLAYNTDKVTRVSPVMYTESVISLLFDFLIFHVAFSAL